MKKIFFFFFSLPVIGLAQSNPNFIYTQTCFGNQTTLVASSSLPDTSIASWKWDMDNNGSFDITGKKIIWLLTQSDSVRLKITPKTGTADSVTQFVVIYPAPQVNFISNNLCENRPAIYISQSTIFTGSITQFLWDFDNNDTIDDNSNDTVFYTCGPAQTYITKLICVSDKGCSAFTQKVTTVYPNPTAAFSTSSVCVNANAIFNNTSAVTNLDFYLWNFGDANQSVTSGNATHAYSSAGTYTVDLIAVSQEGCRDTIASSIIIKPLPIVTIIPGATTLCRGQITEIIASGGVNSLWSTGATTDTIVSDPTITSTYSVVVTGANGCSNTASTTVTVNPLPIISITASDTVLHNGGSITLIANGAANYIWNTGAISISITPDSIGTYIVTGTDMNGCSASDSIMIVSENTDTVSVSGSILTPNGDNINDVLWINNISAYANCDLNIYNIWNDEVYSVKGYKNDWKGTNSSGAELSAGAYYYIVQCDDKSMLKGNINILK